MSRARRSALTALASTGGSVVVLVAGFVAAPYLLGYLGAERYGAFRAASDWLGWLGLLEFGVGGALQSVFARSLGTDDRAGVVAGVRAGVRAYLRVVGLMAVVGVALLAALPTLIRAPDELIPEVWIGGGVSLAALLWVPLAVARPLAEAGQRGYLVQVLTTVQSLVVTATGVGLAAAGWGVVGQFVAVATGGAVFHCILAWLEFRRWPELRRPPVAELPGLWALSWPTLIFNVTSRIGLLTDNILVAAILGPAAVTPFILTQRLAQAALAQVQGIGTASWAGMMDLWYRGERAVFARRLVQLTRLSAVLGVAVLLPVAVWNRQLVGLWVGGEHYAGGPVNVLAAVNAWVLAVTSVWGWPLIAGGKARAVIPCILTSSGLNLAVSAAGTLVLGPVGPLVGTAAALGLVSWWWVLLLLREHFQLDPWPLVSAMLRPVAVALPYGVVLTAVAESIPVYDPNWPRGACWLSLAGCFLGAAGGYLLLAWFLAFPRADRAEWVGRLRRTAA